MFERISSTVLRYTIVLVALAVFAVALPGCRPSPTATPLPPEVTLVVNPEVPEVLAGDTVALTAKASGQNLSFKWSVSRGKLSALDTPSVIYTAPDTEGVDTVTVEVSSASGTTIESVSFNVIAKPTPTPSPTSIPSPTITITSPLTEVVCPLDDECRFDVEGTSSAIASDPNLQAIVWVRDRDLYYPHKWVDLGSDGTWRGHAQIGDRPCWPAGHEFGIVAMALTYDQVGGIATDFQPLPQEYIARSDPIALVTTYDPVPIDLSPASSSYDEAQANVIALTTPEQSRLAFDYDLGSGGWVQVTVPVYNLDMSCMQEAGFSIAFSLEGTGAANSFEVKLEDTDYTSYGWRRPRGSVTANLETIEVPLDHLEFWWDGDGQDTDVNWQEVMNILFAVSQKPGDDGGEGQVTISDVTLIPPATP